MVAANGIIVRINTTIMCFVEEIIASVKGDKFNLNRIRSFKCTFNLIDSRSKVVILTIQCS